MKQRHWLKWCLQVGCVRLLGWLGAFAPLDQTQAQSNIVIQIPENIIDAKALIARKLVDHSNNLL